METSTPRNNRFLQLVGEVALQPGGQILGSQVAGLSFTTLVSLLPGGADAALLTLDGQRGEEHLSPCRELSHHDLKNFIGSDQAGLTNGLGDTVGLRANSRVAVALPVFSPEYFVATMHTMAYACAVPVDPASAPDLLQEQIGGCEMVLVLEGADETAGAIAAAAALGIAVVVLRSTTDARGLYTVAEWRPVPNTVPKSAEARLSAREDEVLLLPAAAAGSPMRRRVAFTLERLVVGMLCVARSRKLNQLTRRIESVSMAPLSQLTALSQQLMVLLLQGTVLCVPYLDADLFCRLVDRRQPAYYVGTASTLPAIVSAAKACGLPKGKMRVGIVEVAGLLDTALAAQVQAVLGSELCQGYGMPECPSITCPPIGTSKSKPGSVGVPVGPEVRVVDRENIDVPLGEDGEILIRGAPLFSGYTGEDNSSTFSAEGWFRTGDRGKLDAEGNLYITGESDKAAPPFAQLVARVPVEADGSVRGSKVAELGFEDLPSLLPTSSKRLALLTPQKPKTKDTAMRFKEMSQKTLASFINNDALNLVQRGLKPGTLVAVALHSHQTEQWVALLYTMAYACAIPVNPAYTTEELSVEMQGCALVLTLAEEENTNVLLAAKEVGAKVVELRRAGDGSGLFEVDLAHRQAVASSLSQRNNLMLLLHTSGSTGNKKRAAHTLETVMVGAICFAHSRGLGEHVNQSEEQLKYLSLMPFYHNAGIQRGLGVMLMGGCIVFAGGFDPQFFWEVRRELAVHFAIATPTMHMSLLNMAKKLGISPGQYPVPIVESVGSTLSAPLARQIHEMFQVEQLIQVYGMTEALPCSVPTLEEQRAGPGGFTTGALGVPCGPEMAIFSQEGKKCNQGVIGRIMVRGCPVMVGYCNSTGQVSKSAFDKDGWFDTGDLGYLDERSSLHLTGRSKEVINRGGETLAPSEIEGACVTHPALDEVMVFSTPHSVLQEAVGIAVTVKDGHRPIDQRQLNAYLEGKLHPSKFPQLIVYMQHLPKSSTNKVQRYKFAERTGLPEIHMDTPPRDCLFHGQGPSQVVPVDTPISVARLEADLAEVERAVRSLPGVSDAWVTTREPALVVAFVTPASLDKTNMLLALQEALDGCNVPDHIVPVATLKEDTMEDALESAITTEMGLVAEKGIDSLGFEIERSSMYEMETKVRDHCYILFIWGIVTDHLYFCTAYFKPDKMCTTIMAFTDDWVNHVVMSIGGTKCQINMLMLAGYFHSARGRSLGVFDAAVFGVYMCFAWLYPWPFWWTLGGMTKPQMFAQPRWFLLCVLYSKLIIATLDIGHRRLPAGLKWLYHAVLTAIIVMLMILGMVWRDYYNMPYFDMCNHTYHSQAVCNLGKFFFQIRPLAEVRVEAVWMWPQMCFWIAIYLFWFECARPAAKLALTVREQLGHEFCRRWFGLLAFLCLVAYFLISYFYKYHRLDEPHFQYFIAVPQGTWKWDHYSYGQLQDIIVFTMQGLMAVFAASQSPLQSAFRTVGSNMLGVFVCQFVLVSVIWNLPNSGGFFATVQAIQTDEYFGDGVLGGIVQLIFLLGLPLLYFYVFSDHATKYVMLPVTIYQYVRTRMPKSGLKMFGTMSSTTPGRADPGEKTPLLGTGEEVPMKNYKSLENRREML